MGCLFPFLHYCIFCITRILHYSCYSQRNVLIFKGATLDSAEGIEQGDPLGPLCFALCLQGLIFRLSSELNVWYLDDGTLAGDP